jgi:cell division protein FtsI/penicillin-binding protein 2
VTGYTDPIYGQSGLEASLDLYLRGLQGNPASSIWWDHLVYGQPPPGLNVRLSLDLELQRQADELLGDHTGAIVLINAASGEILAMASHPTFDPNQLDTQASTLLQDPGSPLLDRAAQGQYPPGDALQPFFQAAGYSLWQSQSIAEAWYTALGFYVTPELNLPVAAASTPGSALRLSPLQMALAAATLSSDGVRPAPRLVMAVDTPAQGWVILPALSEPVTVFPSANAADTAQALMVSGQPFWQWNALVTQVNQSFFWSLGGTLPDWQGAPLAVVVLLEENDPGGAVLIGQTLLEAATHP